MDTDHSSANMLRHQQHRARLGNTMPNAYKGFNTGRSRVAVARMTMKDSDTYRGDRSHDFYNPGHHNLLPDRTDFSKMRQSVMSMPEYLTDGYY